MHRHALLTRGIVSRGDLLAWGRQTHPDAFSPRLFLQPLTYTRDVPAVDSALALLVDPLSLFVMA
ncbi:MAG: hypothetical protein M0Z54_08805 [Thermaerobacter sp.]|nr:hypothetical protein [Thermaerobacter sp.]